MQPPRLQHSLLSPLLFPSSTKPGMNIAFHLMKHSLNLKLYSMTCVPQAEIKEIVKIGYLNGLFVLARSIGLIGHALDQKRLQQPLYRHPWDEVLYAK